MEPDISKLLNSAKTSFSQLDVKAFTEKVSASSSRPSLMHTPNASWKPISHRLASFGPLASPLIDAGSSEEGSDLESSFPSLRQVSDTILDSQHTTITVNPRQDQPTHHRCHPPALIISNLDKRISLNTLKDVLMRIGSGVIKVNAVNFSSDAYLILCGIVFFQTLEEGKV
jgi:hypothetical protein